MVVVALVISYGNTMDGTIFGDHIEVLDEAIVRNGEYEFSNVIVKSVPEAFRARCGDYQMNFNGGVRIKPLDLSACSSEPQYRTLFKIPHEQNDADELIDLVGMVLYVGNAHTIKRDVVKDKVQDILIADQSVSRPMKITAWNHSAGQHASFFQSWPEAFNVVGFTSIRPITYRGISLVTKSSTAYVEHPTGEVADALRVWATENKRMLEDWRGKAILLYNETSDKTPLPLDSVAKKKASTIWQDEKFWVQVTIPSLEEKDVFCYTGCNKCGCSTTDKLKTKSVYSRCKTQDVVAAARVLMNIMVSDKTGTLKISIFINKVELVFVLKVDEITTLKKSAMQKQ